MTDSTALVEIGAPPDLVVRNTPALFLTNEKAAERFSEFFTANINKDMSKITDFFLHRNFGIRELQQEQASIATLDEP